MEERRTYTEEFKKDAVELSFNSSKTVKEIAKIYWQHKGHYGSPRIYRELRKKAINAILKESQD